MASVEQAPAAAQGGTGIPVENPATGETIATLPTLSASAVKALVARARAAQPAWEAIGFEERGRVLRRAQKWVTDNSERIIATIVSETGKTYEDAQLAEIMYAAAAFGFWAKEAPHFLADEPMKSANPLVKGKKLVVRYRPVGVVGVIGPWNFPLTNSFGDCIPALAAGNAVILKPSEVTPLTSLLMAEGLRAAGLPDDVFQVATGDGATGSALIDHVDFVMFTGSTKTGKKVMERAAKTLTPVGLELGGKDPMIVLADADLDRAANAAAYYSMNNGGQVCISIERVYVEAPAYDEFVRKVTDRVKSLRQGRPSGPGSIDVGAVTFPPQLDIIEAHVADAVAKGARVLTGGRAAPGPGMFYEPTVLVDVDHTMSCMTEETFGPTLPIMKVADADEALRLANDSPYGLQASVWTKDLRRGEQLARRVEAGAVCVNDAQVNYTALELPMGGWKSSGLGTRHGAGGIRKYTQQQTLLVTRFAGKRDPHMFPYSKRVTKLIGGLTRLLYGRGKRA
ncbi:succinic semialdehyde dehydrogenase [Conexibacter sp. CPCC 206217]|uniref:succinic semialdehyde dehydrogenase n=1 Tax=Conexibacter sp. CPCC 206217 TaxID=3064574 RepID=UPI002718523E|nr:succinic semialdehyde dehydrogenase [Conexibacter sp. CPCC 206217]MDO8211915.1 succinic semialdehyde dehydrogenase [Conexibacter sp. CPCC 206217]